MEIIAESRHRFVVPGHGPAARLGGNPRRPSGLAIFRCSASGQKAGGLCVTELMASACSFCGVPEMAMSPVGWDEIGVEGACCPG